MENSNSTEINSPISAAKLVEGLDLIGTVLCSVGVYMKHKQTATALEGLTASLHSLRILRDSFETLNDMNDLRDITSAEYAADLILEDLNSESN
jgi:hypothetical protein